MNLQETAPMNIKLWLKVKKVQIGTSEGAELALQKRTIVTEVFFSMKKTFVSARVKTVIISETRELELIKLYGIQIKE